MFAHRVLKKLESKKADAEMCRAVGRFLRAPKNGRLLDIGVGDDRLLRRQGDKGLNLYGVDISAADRSRSIDELALTDQASIEELPYNDGFFHCVTALDTAVLWENKAAALAELFRVLRSGGQLLCAFRFDSDNGSGTPPRTLRSQAREAGFERVGVKVLRSEGCYLLIGDKP